MEQATHSLTCAGRGKPRGFTLVELLTVVAIIAVLLGFVVPAFTSISQGTDLTRAGQDFADTLTLARDEAMSRNRKVTVRIIQQAGSTPDKRYRAAQVWVVKDDAGTTVPLGKVIQFPNRIVFAESKKLSSLLQAASVQSGTMTVAGVSCSYLSFTINANGMLDISTADTNNANTYLTMVQEKDVNAADAPANFFSVFINPATGEFSTFRP